MKILMVLTSHDRLGDTGHKTGFWLEEFAAPYYVFKDAGAQLVLASPKGGQPPLDPKSDAPDAQTAATVRFNEDAEALSGVDTFLARAAAAGRRVFTQLGDSPQLGWVLCTTDKTDEVCGQWRTCKHCKLTFDGASLAAGHYVCPSCGGYMRMTSDERIDDLLDAGTFQEWDRAIKQTDPLGFPGYLDILELDAALG